MKSVAGEKTSDIKRELVLSAEEDYLDLASVAGTVEEVLGLTDERDVLAYTLGVLSELLREGSLRPGIPTADGGFEPWRGGLKGTLVRVESEWRAMRRRPALGEVVWFDATDRGISYLEDTE